MTRTSKSTPRPAASKTIATTPTEGKRDRNKREKRDRIVASARRLFRENGYAGTTTQQIAEAAGIASGTLFLYAKSKEDLLLLVFTAEMQELIERAYDGIDVSAPLIEQILALFKRFVSYHARDVELAHQLIREITFLRNPDRRGDLRDITNAITEKLTFILERGVARQELNPETDLPLLASCLFSIYYQQLQTWLSGFVTRRRFERTLSSMVAFVVDLNRIDT